MAINISLSGLADYLVKKLTLTVFGAVTAKLGLFTFIYSIMPILMDSIYSLVSTVIPPPDLASLLTHAPQNLIYILGVINLGTGVRVISTAFLTRFMVRRIPFIG